MKVAFLGLGRMGTAMARLLLQSGHSVSVWNRSPQAAAPLVADGATHAPSVQAAVANCDAACTMLADDAATEQVVFGTNSSTDNLLHALPKHAVHLAHGTLSVALSKRLADAHAAAGQFYVGAPVFGRPNVAAAGRLWIVAAGARAALEHAQPVLAALGRGVTFVGEEPWQAHAFKLGGNMLISAMVQSLSESFVYAESQGLDREIFLETVNEALFQSPMYANYGKLMLHPPEHAGGTIAVGAKDTRLLREAAGEAQVRLPLADYLQQQFDLAIAEGMEQVDWAVGQYRMAQKVSKS